MAVDDDPLQISVRQFLGDEKQAASAYSEVLIKTLVNTALPFGIGSAITGLMSEEAQRVYKGRVAELFNDFAVKIRSIEARIPDRAYFGSEEFLSLFVEAVDQQRTNRHREKRRMLASGLANSGATPFTTDPEKESYFRVLRDLTPGDLKTLMRVAPQASDLRIPWDKSHDYFRPKVKAPKPPEDSTFARLEGLGLVRSALSFTPSNPDQVAPYATNEREAIKMIIESQAVTTFTISEFGKNFLSFLQIDAAQDN